MEYDLQRQRDAVREQQHCNGSWSALVISCRYTKGTNGIHLLCKNTSVSHVHGMYDSADTWVFSLPTLSHLLYPLIIYIYIFFFSQKQPFRRWLIFVYAWSGRLLQMMFTLQQLTLAILKRKDDEKQGGLWKAGALDWTESREFSININFNSKCHQTILLRILYFEADSLL